MSVGFRSAIVLCFDRLFSWVLLCMQCAENLESMLHENFALQ